jgi:PmbA protein
VSDGPSRLELAHEIRAACGANQLEVYLKRGRSRRFVRIAGLEHQSEAVERGWAVRATTDRGSFFRCGTGYPEPSLEWPVPEAHPLRLPEPRTTPPWQAPPELDAPLGSESELRSIGNAIDEAVRSALPDARLEHLSVEDGQSQSWLASTRGVDESWRGRAAVLIVEASSVSAPSRRVRVEVAQREVRELRPTKLASRLVDLLTVRAEGQPVARDRSEIVVAPRVGSRLVAGLWPLVDPRYSESVLTGLGAGEEIGGPALSLIDDGRLPDGVLAAPVDGEGMPTREVVLVEQGVFRQPLLPWWMASVGRRAGGCSRRFSWRDEPQVGPSHLYLAPDPAVRATDLVGSISRGYYFLDCSPQASFDYEANRFSLPVRGFEVLGGQARRAVDGVRLVGRISGLLSGIRSVARDLAFSPGSRGLFGSPTVRLVGLEIRAE